MGSEHMPWMISRSRFLPSELSFGPWGGSVGASIQDVANRSRLTAIDLKTGKIAWERGRADWDHTSLAESYFLGPPLPVAGQLDVLTEKNEQITLACVELEGGTPIWIRPLSKASIPLLKDASRRIHAAHLAYADGTLICPTHDGAVVGVDIAARKVTWTYLYSGDKD